MESGNLQSAKELTSHLESLENPFQVTQNPETGFDPAEEKNIFENNTIASERASQTVSPSEDPKNKDKKWWKF